MIKKETKAAILLVDDEETIRSLLTKALTRAGYRCESAENGQAALDCMEKNSFDLMVTDVHMPVMDGVELTKKVLEQYNTDVIIMTGKGDRYKYNQFIRIGASDFAEKPFSLDELELRVERVLKERDLRRKNEEAHQELKEAYLDSIHRLVMASEFKDEDTGDHITRMGEYSRLLARKIGWSEKEMEIIYYASPMHDVGKIGIPDSIMQKPGKLTKEEFDVMKTHTNIGARLLSQSKSVILKMARTIALTHHEKFNGCGYPEGLSGKNIPVAGRIVAIADTFDALTSSRPYKDPYPPEMAFDIIEKETGQHFDPDISRLFLDDFDDFLAIRQTIGSFETIDLDGFTLSERDQEKITT